MCVCKCALNPRVVARQRRSHGRVTQRASQPWNWERQVGACSFFCPRICSVRDMGNAKVASPPRTAVNEDHDRNDHGLVMVKVGFNRQEWDG